MHAVRRRSRSEIANRLMQAFAEHGPGPRKSVDQIGKRLGVVPVGAGRDRRPELDELLNGRPRLHRENILGGAVLVEAAASQRQLLR